MSLAQTGTVRTDTIWSQSLGAAKALVADRAVAVDGEIETRVRRKLRAGNTVRVADEEIRVLAADDRSDIEPSAAAAGPPAP